MSTIDEVKARIDIVDLISETVQLRRSGKSYTGFCPFHQNTRTPSFVVFPDTGTWRCFGQCNEGGDIFKFVMKKEGWDFVEALRRLAEKAGVQLRAPSPKEQAAAEEHAGLRGLLEEAVVFYRHQLLNTPAGVEALTYLRQRRGLQDATIEAFGLGYAPAGWDTGFGYFRSKGYRESDLLAVGLLTQRDPDGAGRSGVYDRFRHRLMIPIRDERGRMAGFGARILNPEDVPKFLNSPQTALFDKGHLLYGLHLARAAIRKEDCAVIVEGYLDVIALHQAGFANAVSPMGTALTEHQLHLLQRLGKRIVLALDPDAAGDKATLRGLQVARQSLDREDELVFDARGLLGHARRLQADIRVSTLPPGLDPDEVVQRDPQLWQQIVANARPVVIHVMETLAAGEDLDDPRKKSEIAAQVLPLIEDVPDAIERDAYRQRLARLLRVNEGTLQGMLVVPARPRRRQGQGRLARSTQADKSRSDLLTSARLSVYLLESHCLGVLVRRPDLLYQIDRKLQEDGLGRLSPEDFQHADHQAVLRLLQNSLDQDMAEPLSYALNGLSLPMMEAVDDMLARTEKLDPSEDKVLEDLMRGLLDLRYRSLNQGLEHLRYLLQDAQEQGDLRAMDYSRTVQQYTQKKSLIDKALGRYTSRNVAVRTQG